MTAILIPLLVISLAFAIYAAWRWRPRAYLVRGPFPEGISERARQGIVSLVEPCLSCGRAKPPDAACPTCGFCGVVFASDPRNPLPPKGRLVSEGMPASANEAKDSSRREAAS
jgi:hypothetical protein